MNGTTLTPEMEKLLGRYLRIQDEARRLDEEKAQLKDRLASHLAGFTEPFWFPVVAGQPLKIRVQHAVDFTYNEELLRQRLGERYTEILRPDPAKIRRHLAAVEDLLRPALNLVGSPHRDQVRVAVERGAVPKDAFAGAFEKVSRTTIAVMRQRDGEAAPAPRR
jgi:hypothetical protein